MENIVVKEVSYQYTRRNENDEVIETLSALSALDFSIETGSFVCILGHNGSGKSTLAKLFNALQLPTEGTILVSGMDSREEKNIFPIRREVGMVFQNPDNQIIASVVEEDVGFGPENIGLPTDEIWQRVNNALSAVHMEAYRLKSPNHLSGGQKQRVAIAGTLAMEAEEGHQYYFDYTLYGGGGRCGPDSPYGQRKACYGRKPPRGFPTCGALKEIPHGCAAHYGARAQVAKKGLSDREDHSKKRGAGGRAF